MRDLLILAIVIVAAVLALRRPWVGVMLWTWLSVMNPHRFAWSIAYDAPVAAIAAAATLVGLLFTKDRQSPFQGAATWWLAAFSVWVTLSWLLGMDPDGDQPMWDRVMKIYFMTFVALALLKTKLHVISFAWVTIGSLALLAVKGGLFTILTGGNYRVYGPPESFIADNNDFALAIIVAIPMVHFLQLQVKKGWRQHAFSAVIVLCAASALGSQSRGALIAIVPMAAVFWWRSNRKVAIGALIALVLVALLPMMPDTWWERMSTISSYGEDASAMGRINAWHVAWQTALHEFFGAGMTYQYADLFERYGPYETTVRAAHSIYFQTLGNHGFVGLFLFVMIWVATLTTARWLRKNAKEIPQALWAYQMGTMVQVSLISYAVGGAFLSLQYFDLPYNLMVMALLARQWVERRAWESEPSLTLLEALGLKSRRAPARSQAEPRPDLSRTNR